MKSFNPHNARKSLTALAVSATLFAASAVHADFSSGSIYGHAKSGETVSILNTATGMKREIVVDSSGRYSFAQLPSGHYKVTQAGSTKEVDIVSGVGTSVDFDNEVANADVIEVVGSRISAIDTSSVESSSVFRSSQIEQLPVPRDLTSVALLAPGTVKGDTGFGNLASFGGSSVAENGYYVNGFDVTNIRNFLSFADLPFDAVAEQQVKTGGYGAEYGRSLGGVVSLITKRGTNEWESGASVYWTPEQLRSHSANVTSKDKNRLQAGNYLYVYRSDNTHEELTYNVHTGGPLIQDTLFVYALVEGREDTRNTYFRENSQQNSNDSPQSLIKLDWNINDSNLLEFTYINNRVEDDITTYRNRDVMVGYDPILDAPITAHEKYTGRHGKTLKAYTQRDGGEVWIGKYTGYLTDDLTLSAMIGKLNNTRAYQHAITNYQNIELGVTSCPTVYDSIADRTQVVYRGCWDEDNFANIKDASFGPDKDERKANRLDLEWHLGDHSLRGGLDYEKFTSSSAGRTYEGGIYYRLFRTGATSRAVNGVTVAPNTDYVRVRHFNSASGEFEIENTAVYLEDSWQITNDFMLYLGLRSESFDNKNGDGVSFVDASNLIAPRLGFSWDPSGNGEDKVYGNFGRYYIPVASNTNIRASAAEQTITDWYLYDGVRDPVTWAPVNALGTHLGVQGVTGSLSAPDPRTVADTDLEPMYQDELILGYQHNLGNNWVGGVKAIYRKVKNGMDDYCSRQAFVDWAADNNYDNFDYHSMATCVIINPGNDVNIALDLEDDGNLVDVTVPNSYLKLPEYKRTYKALEFTLERAKQDGWYLQGSYTWAKSEGNVEGYVNSTLEQADAGLTQDFDNSLFEDGANGPLPNDRRHTFKLFGTYDLSESWTVAGNFVVQSGRPINCNGFIPLDPNSVDTTLQNYSASSFYCVDESGQTTLHKRGDAGRTPWTVNVDAGLQYVVSSDNNGKLALKLDIFNLFNFQKVTEYNETSDFDRGSPTRSPDYLNDVNYQTPRSVRLSARYEF